mmetsp:Transcript_21083/g.32659  ORF Transcript_21083/g.32659 Transcript_21083/m.32659 type:complete len:209 (+) Transcript_21083:3517-4143(+)
MVPITVSESSAAIKVQLQYFNGRLDSWEPFFERCELKYGLETGPQSSKQIINAVQAVKLNLTEEVLESINAIQQPFESDGEVQLPMAPTGNSGSSIGSIGVGSQKRQRINPYLKATLNYRIVNMTARRLYLQRNLHDYRKILSQAIEYHEKMEKEKRENTKEQIISTLQEVPPSSETLLEQMDAETIQPVCVDKMSPANNLVGGLSSI